MATHRVFVESLDASPLIVTGDEAHHAIRVKRLETGDPIACFDGRGTLVQGRVANTAKLPRTGEWSLQIEVTSRHIAPRPSPHIECWTALPKGGRATEMVEGLSEVGAAFWAPLHTARSIVEPGDHKLAKLQRAAVEAGKQCGRPWLLDIGEGGDLPAATQNVPSGGVVLVADGSGDSLPERIPPWVRILIGPEGGWSDEEMAWFTAQGLSKVRFGPHIMRLETAAVAAAAIVISRQMT
ncbi:MAG: 16S rRNA (uracil(1498)-N(3))-methyltransferase [Planctomycetes bacterium]|nr:16S rRNA (uracil(1498)-N(3))-methyltransferase [Planctomycetota bacterium]